MRTRSQTKNEALKTKSTVQKSSLDKSSLDKSSLDKSSLDKSSLDKSSNDKPLKQSLIEKPVTRSSTTNLNQNPTTCVDTTVHLINSMDIPKPLTIQRPPKPILYEPIDFDDASACWRMNKQSLGNGQYKYVCAFMKIDNTRCGRNVKKGCMACRNHV
jgi:hypothetical protein